MRTRARLPRGLAGAEVTSSGGATSTATTRTVHVALACELAEGMLVVVATTVKRGAAYHDRWSITPSLNLVSVTRIETTLRHRAAYVSRATVVESSLESETTYTFSYAIVMSAGERVWAGSGSVIVTVGPDGSAMPHDGGGNLAVR